MKIDITTSALELAAVIHADPEVIEPALLSHGERLITLFENPTLPPEISDISEMKREVFCMALEDLAMGAYTLKASVIGLSFSQNKLNTFIAPFDVVPEGNVLTSISLKNTDSVRRWRAGEIEELDQSDINAALYRIVVALSEMTDSQKEEM